MSSKQASNNSKKQQKQKPVATATKTKAKKVAKTTKKHLQTKGPVTPQTIPVKPLPTRTSLHNDFVKSSTQDFDSTPFHYRQVPRDHADQFLMDDRAARRQEDEMVSFLDSPLLMVTDPVLRETLRQEENVALNVERKREANINKHLLSQLSSNEKVKALIKEGASNRQIINAMYNLLPRVLPTRKLRHNIDSLDWLGSVRHRWQNEVEPNGYDVEDSEDPDTLPQQRAFTKDEMNRLLQDVEESKFIESDVEEALFAPTAAISDLKRELQQAEN